MGKLKKVITLEEHFHIRGWPIDIVPKSDLLWDLGSRRLEDMDRLGIDIQVLSLLSPGIQAIADTSEAIAKAKWVNDHLAEVCRSHPSRFAGFAALPTQDPRAAAAELERCVRDLGFKGGLVNGHTNGRYLDEEPFLPLWEKCAELDVPLYLHPAPAPRMWEVFENYPELSKAVWGYFAETGAQVLRLVGSGLFDRFPEVTVIIGHMGENLPYCLSRIDSRTGEKFHARGVKKRFSEYIRSNVVITTSGTFDNAPLRCALETMGGDAVMFSIDYPLEDRDEAMRWIREAPLSDAERDAVSFENAARILKI